MRTGRDRKGTSRRPHPLPQLLHLSSPTLHLNPPPKSVRVPLEPVPKHTTSPRYLPPKYIPRAIKQHRSTASPLGPPSVNCRVRQSFFHKVTLRNAPAVCACLLDHRCAGASTILRVERKGLRVIPHRPPPLVSHESLVWCPHNALRRIPTLRILSANRPSWHQTTKLPGSSLTGT